MSIVRNKFFRPLPAVAGAAVLVLSTATPATANECYTYGCGGAVLTHQSSRSVLVANHWCWSVQHLHFGAELPCVTNHRTWYAHPADNWLPTWDNSDNYYYYHDTDAVRFDGGCTYDYYWNNEIHNVQREDWNSTVWMRITGTNRVTITRVSCG